MRINALTAASFIAGALAFSQAQAIEPSPPAPIPAAGSTTGLMHAIHATKEVDKTLAFYTEVFGLQGKIAAFANEHVPILTNTPGVKLQVSMLRMPGEQFGFELTQFSNEDRHGAQPEIWDPGAPHMKMLVRDIEPVFAAVKRLNAPILTASKAPVTINTDLGKVKAIFFRDPDGYIVEAVQVTPQPGAPDGNLIGAIIGVTVSDLDTASKFWHDIMGLTLAGDRRFSTDKAYLDLMGVPKGGSFRTVTSVLPGSRARIEFTEFKGPMARKPFSLRVPDPGSSGMAIRVAAIQDLLPSLKAKGYRILSKDQALVEWDAKLRNFFVKDPDGLNLELVGNAPGVQ